MGLGKYIGAGAAITKGIWRLNGDSNDASGNAQHGVDTSITYLAANGKFGLGAGFTTASKIDINGMAVAQDKTILAWVKLTTNTVTQCIFSQWRYVSATDANTHKLNITSLGKLRYSENIQPGDGGDEVIGLTTIPVGVWTLVAATISGLNVKLYINGVLDIADTLWQRVLNFTPSANGTTIGTFWYSATNSYVDRYRGAMCEVILENTVWTPEKIKKYYTASVGRFGL